MYCVKRLHDPELTAVTTSFFSNTATADFQNDSKMMDDFAVKLNHNLIL